jgi:Ni,Fe-hydrogenase maturation factor
MTQRKRVLVLGFGNPGRLDDGLGGAAAAAVDALRTGPASRSSSDLPAVRSRTAAAVAAHDHVVIFDRRGRVLRDRR